MMEIYRSGVSYGVTHLPSHGALLADVNELMADIGYGKIIASSAEFACACFSITEGYAPFQHNSRVYPTCILYVQYDNMVMCL